MNRLLKVLGTIALIVIGLYMALAALDVAFEIVDDLFYWFRRSFLPGMMWACLIGAVLWVLYGLFTRRGIFR